MATVRQYPLERAKILKKFIVSEIGYSFIFLLLAVLAFLFASASGLVAPIVTLLVVLFIILSLVNLWYQGKYYRVYFYNVKEDFLVIKKGVFMPRETILPFEKLQDVYLDQDIFDRIFSLWDLHVSTATYMSGFEAHIDGVNISNGEAIRELLLNKIKGKE
ncbi:MAG TPA: PH domain-containing protein [archaeon]|nr:PH domain-containing protein [archaeon]